MLEDLLVSAVWGAVAYGIISLSKSTAYKEKVKGPWKILIALALGAISFNFSSTLFLKLYSLSSRFVGEGLAMVVFSYVAIAISYALPAAVGVVVYYALCNPTKAGRIWGYVLFAIMVALMMLKVVLHAKNDEILMSAIHVAGIVAGSFALYKFHRVDETGNVDLDKEGV